ncbi:DinB family protein [Fulvivirgaceae bacterium BMA10]|uniref:DinB family protein n=1 Tax=Splendidivirga corallicola TaxID=3051826 RepID=A0ABT8KYW0_9BACT|nr:DinB family protein [Fulvivirgaceae bacterium BMA10]
MIIHRPLDSEYPEFYHRYVQLVPDNDVLKFLKKQKRSFIDLIKEIPEKKQTHRYAAGKWSIKEVVGHAVDTERIMANRALAFSRGEAQSIPGFDENAYVEKASFDSRSMESFVKEFTALRDSNMTLFESFSEVMIDRKGSANERLFTVRSIIYIVAGHLEHHQLILKERYLGHY